MKNHWKSWKIIENHSKSLKFSKTHSNRFERVAQKLFSLVPHQPFPKKFPKNLQKHKIAPMSLEKFLSLDFYRLSLPPPIRTPARLQNCNNKSKNHCLPTQKSRKKCFFPIEKYTNSVNQENEKEQQKKLIEKRFWFIGCTAKPARTERETKQQQKQKKSILCSFINSDCFVELFQLKLTLKASSESIRVRFWVEVGRSIAAEL